MKLYHSKTFSVSATEGDDMWRLLKEATASGITAAAMLRWTLRALIDLHTSHDELPEKVFNRMAKVISNTSIIRFDYVASPNEIANALDAVDHELAKTFRSTSMSKLMCVALMARARAIKAGEVSDADAQETN